MTREVVAVRYSCDLGCEWTAVAPPGKLPTGWFEWPAPPWRAHHRPRYCCPDHAAEGRRLAARQWAVISARQYAVSAADYETAKVALRHASFLLDRLRHSGERDGSR